MAPKNKIFKENAGGFPGEISIPSMNHPNRAAFDRSFVDGVKDRFGGGKLTSLKVASIDGVGNSGHGVVNKPRYKLYSIMAHAGDRLPPVVVESVGKGRFGIVDGAHRMAAARDASMDEIDAYIIAPKKGIKKSEDSLSMGKDQFDEDACKTKEGGPLEKVDECDDNCCDFDEEQLRAGIKQEITNGVPKEKAVEAAMDHLVENPDYYKDLKKEALHHGKKGHHFSALPVGTLLNGKIKVLHADGKSGWKGVRAGMIQGQERGAALFGENSHPVSSREPSSK